MHCTTGDWVLLSIFLQAITILFVVKYKLKKAEERT